MKRDLDLARNIMLSIENHEKEILRPGELEEELRNHFPAPAWTDSQLVEHVKLLTEGGFVEAKFQSHYGAEVDILMRVRLTWEGHEFIANAKHNEVWEEVKKAAGNFSVAILKDILLSKAERFRFLSSIMSSVNQDDGEHRT